MKKSEITELAILQQASYHEEAFEQLYERYHRLVYYVAFQLCHNDADAQDVVQETFMEVKRSLPHLKNPQYFRLWLYRIIQSKCKKLFRKNKYVFTDIEQDHLLNAFLEENEQYLPEEQLKYRSDRELMHSFIQKLPYPQRYAVYLYYMEQLTTLEIAQLLDVPEGTEKSRLSVSRAGLKKSIELYERKEGTKLNFHEGFGGAAIASLIGESTLPVVFHNHPMQTLCSSFKSASLAMKAFALIECSALFLFGTLAVGELRSLSREMQQDEMRISTFPLLQFQGNPIQTNKDAYYTLKMNICTQDIAQLSEERHREALPLYLALKEENSVYYEQLKQSGWAAQFDAWEE